MTNTLPTVWGRLALALLLLIGSAPLNAENRDQQAERIWDQVVQAAQRGPQVVDLTDESYLDLPDGYAFIPPQAAKPLMAFWGNQVGEDFLGLVMSTDDANWFVEVAYEKSGYIRDDDARNWDTDELLDNLKEGTEAGNDFRKSQGISPIEVVGWVEEPHYDGANHRLIWSAQVNDKGAPVSDASTINYNTYLLGRKGYLSLNLVTDQASIAQFKPVARTLLDDVHFRDGSRYADFNESTDDVAAYGLAALVGGVAAKKLGLLALIGAFLIKAWKIVAIAAFGGLAAIRKFFGRAR